MNKVLPLLIVLAFAGCKKDNDTAGLLTRSWQITARTTKTNADVSIPMDISSCDYNKIWTFKKDGSFSSEPSPACVANGFVDVFNGTWILTGDKTLKIEAQGGSGAMYLDADIVMLTKSKLILRTWLTLDGREGVRGGGGGFAGAGSQVITEFSAR
jgi:hypothetical protein